MAKTSGLGQQCYVSGIDVSGDVGSLTSLTSPRATLDVTGIDKSAYERIHGRKDGSLEYVAYFNPATGAAHDTFAAMPTADVHEMWCTGTTIGDPAACMVAKQLDYAGDRADDGAFTFKIASQANGYGLEWGRLLTAGKRTDGSATNGSAYDYGAAVGTTAFGLQLYVHLFAFTGTSVTVKVQESSDNGGADSWADVVGATSGALSAVGSVRAATAVGLSVERYLRIVTSGTFSNAVLAAAVVRNLVAPAF